MKQVWLLALLLVWGGAELEAQLIVRPDSNWSRIRAAIQAENPRLKAQRGAADVAALRARAARAVPPGTVSAEAEDGGGSIRVDVGRELWSGGRRRRARLLAESEARRAGAEVEALDRRLAIRADHLLLVSATERAVGGRVAAAESLLAVVEEVQRNRFATGESRYADVLRLRAERLRLASEQVDRLDRSERARAALVALLAGAGTGSTTSKSLDLAIQGLLLDSLPVILPDSITVDQLLSQSGPVMLARAEADVARSAAVLARAETRPALAGSLGVQRYESGSGHALGPAIGLSLTLPFTSAGPVRMAGAAAMDTLRADLVLHAVMSESRASSAEALARYRSARARLAIYQSGLLRAAGDEREVALAGFRTGEVSLLELLDFEMALLRADVARLDLGLEAAGALAAALLGEESDTHLSGEDGRP